MNRGHFELSELLQKLVTGSLITEKPQIERDLVSVFSLEIIFFLIQCFAV